MCGEHFTGKQFPCEIDEALRRAGEYVNQLPADLRNYYTAALENCFKKPVLEE